MSPYEYTTVPTGSVKLYECFDCGRRDEDVDRRICRSCGGELQYIGRPRDE